MANAVPPVADDSVAVAVAPVAAPPVPPPPPLLLLLLLDQLALAVSPKNARQQQGILSEGIDA